MSIQLEAMPKLGFGLMRLPEKEGTIDIEQVCRMVDAYMEAGMNYFDTAYVYHGGNSEKAIREALVKRYPRNRFMLATKLPAWCMKERSRQGSHLQRAAGALRRGLFRFLSAPFH